MKHKKAITGISLAAIAVTCFASGVLALNPKTTAASTEDGFHVLGASVRISSNEEDRGIRFAFGLPEAKTGDGYTIGTLVIAKEALGDKVLNHNDDNTDAVTVDYERIDCSKNWIPHEKLDNAKEGYNYYNAALTNIPELNYDTTLVARSYYVKDGVYTYSDPVERSIGWVAAAALNNGENDTEDKILTGFVKGGFGETTFEVGGKELVSATEEIAFTATNDKGYLPVWSSSNAQVATVDKDGKITIARGGETTITATIGDKVESKTLYVVGEGLYADQIGIRVNGHDMTNEPQYMTMSIGENGEMIINAKFIASWDNYHAGLVWNNIESKAYYVALANAGYKYLSYDLKVEGADDDKVSDLYAFCGQQLTKIPQENGVYKVQMLVSDISRVYEAIQVNLPNGKRQGEIGTRHGMFLAWRDNRGTDKGVERNYIFTISNPKFVIPELTMDFAEGNKEVVEVGKTTTLTAAANVTGDITWSSSNNEIATVQNGVVTGVKGGEVTITATLGDLTASKTVYVVGDGLYSNQIGVLNAGWDYTTKADYFNMNVGENGEMIVTTKIQAVKATPSALVLRELYSKAYYEKLIAEGYTKLTFSLAVGGANAANVSDLYVFDKALTSFAKNSKGEYQVVADIQTIVDNYDTIGVLGLNNKQATSEQFNKMLLGWKDTTNNWAARNYVFTISNAAFKAAPTLEVAADVAEIAYGETATLTATTNWDVNDVVWTTSDETIATVENGEVTVTGENWGEVTITATVDTVSVDTTITVKAPTISVDFAAENKNIIAVKETTTLVATTNWNPEKVVWSSSDETIATVENGVVTGVKGGEVTITATLGDLTASKTVYVVGNTLDTDSFAVIAGAWNQPTYITTTTGENDEMVITAQFKGDQWRWPAVVLRNLESKAFYEALLSEGYTKFSFDLAVGGANAADVSDLYVFGELLSNSPCKDGVYTIIVDVQHIVDNYDTIGILGTSVEAVPSKYHAQMFISWKCTASNASTTRNYEFTLSNGKYLYKEGDLYSNQLGIHAYGWNQTNNPTYFNMARGNNGEMIVTAQMAGSTTHYPAVVLRELFNKEYYQNLIAEGYTKLTFSLAVGGANAANVSDLYVFGKALTSFVKNSNGAYTVVVDLQYIVDNYAKVSGIGTSVEAKNAEVDYMFLAWKSTDWTKRNYVFTIANPIYVKGVLFADDFGFRDGGVNKTYDGMTVDTGANGEIIINTTFNATDKYGSFLMFNNMDTITYLAGLKGTYASFTFELTVEGGAVNDLHTFGTAKAISTCNKVSGKDNTYVVEIRLDMTYFTASGWKTNMNTFMTSTGQAGTWEARSQMLLAWRYNSSAFSGASSHAPRNYTFTIANFELRETLLYSY